MGMRLALILAAVALVHGMDRTLLQQAPPPMKGFNLQPFLGRWFVQFHTLPCSWSGASEFRDYEVDYSMEGKNTLIHKERMRTDLCNTVMTRLYILSPPGVFLAKQTLGNIWSGSYILPATDYKTFAIAYGCTKMSVVGDKCDDAWAGVVTRMPHPGPKVIVLINQALNRLWGVTVNHFQPVLHKKSCLAKQPMFPYNVWY